MSVVFQVRPPISAAALNTLFAEAWPESAAAGAVNVNLDRALVYAGAYDGERLVGFAKVIGDGGLHGFLLDPTVDPAFRRRGIGRRLVALCVDEARRAGVEWVHVDYEPALEPFYRACGFRSTAAGVLNLKESR